MRAAVRSVLVAIGIASAMVAGPAGASLAAVNQSHGFAIESITPARGQLVGVAHPVVVTFAKPVSDRQAAERAVAVTSSPAMTGKFEWLSQDVVQWIPDHYWPAHSTVKLSVGGLSTDFQTGAVVLGVASISEHTFTVSIDGIVEREMPASMGKASRPTPMGNFNVMSKERTVIMDSRTIGIPLSDPEGYRLSVDYAERITSGGVYVHSAPWSVGSQGYANVSHGCINLSPDNAEWYYETVNVGDPVNVVG